MIGNSTQQHTPSYTVTSSMAIETYTTLNPEKTTIDNVLVILSTIEPKQITTIGTTLMFSTKVKRTSKYSTFTYNEINSTTKHHLSLSTNLDDQPTPRLSTIENISSFRPKTTLTNLKASSTDGSFFIYLSTKVFPIPSPSGKV